MTDEELARRVQQGDRHALEELIARYTPKLLRYGHRFLASQDDIGDVVQDVFISVYENIQDFDAARHFSPWIYRIAHNAFANVLRKKSNGPIFGLDLDRVVPHPVYEDPDESEKEREEMRVVVEGRVRELPAAYREVIDLYYFEEFSYQEMADILRLPLGTVGIRLSRARAMLKKRLTQRSGEKI